jgi:hypothetical protein
MRLRRAVRVRAVLLCGLVLVSTPRMIAAQETASASVAEANRLRYAGEFDEAIRVLQAHLRAYPDDGEAIRALAQTQYWARDFAGARETYERALKLHPEDSTLRAQYAQFIAETRTQRGWIKFVPAFHHDDQPLDRVQLQAEAGWYMRPGSSIALQLSGTRFRLGDTASRNVETAGVAFLHTDAQSGFTAEISGGVLQRSFDDAAEFIGGGSVSIAMSPAVRLRGSFDRSGYFHTEASLSSPVMTNTAAAFLTLNSSSAWLGEISAQLQQYPDDNSTTTAYAWLLAPIVHSAGQTVHVGYSGAFQDAKELRYELEQKQQSASPASPNFNFAGRYAPYYTPLNLQTHSVIAALAFGMKSPAVLRINGGYAVLGSENSPRFVPVSLTAPPRTEARRAVSQRDTHPWNARATLELNSAGSSPLVLGAETSRTSFYTSLSGFVAWTLKF